MDDTKALMRALVVDDEKLVADSLVMILKAKGWQAIAAYSGEEAVELCATFDPEVVVSDIVMGPMSGFDLAIDLAEHRPGCRIILMSGHSFHNPLVAQSMRRGFDFLSKPIDPLKFLAKVCGPAAIEESPTEPMRETATTDE